MRSVFIISFIANLILTVVVLVVGPDTMAIHFGAGGEPNGWASAKTNALTMAGIGGLFFLLFFFMPQLMRITPDKWINLPNKDYWLKEGNRGRAMTMLNKQLYKLGAAMFIFMFVVGLLVLQANLSDPVLLREDLFWPPLIFIMVYAGFWTVRIYRIFRVPKEEGGQLTTTVAKAMARQDGKLKMDNEEGGIDSRRGAEGG